MQRLFEMIFCQDAGSTFWRRTFRHVRGILLFKETSEDVQMKDSNQRKQPPEGGAGGKCG